MSQMQSGGSMPSMEDIMSDPSLRDLSVVSNIFNPLFLKVSSQSYSVWRRQQINVVNTLDQRCGCSPNSLWRNAML
jgi:hypothetical protein